MILIKLFLVFLKIGAFSFGGGYAVLSLIQKEIVESYGWISGADFIDIVAIAEMTPGPIAVNASTFVGYKLGGFAGSLIGTLSVLLIPFTVVLLVSIYFNKFKHLDGVKWVLRGIRPAVLGLIASACFKIAKISFIDYKGVIIAILIFISVYKYKIHPIIALLLSGLLGILFYGLL